RGLRQGRERQAGGVAPGGPVLGGVGPAGGAALPAGVRAGVQPDRAGVVAAARAGDAQSSLPLDGGAAGADVRLAGGAPLLPSPLADLRHKNQRGRLTVAAAGSYLAGPNQPLLPTAAAVCPAGGFRGLNEGVVSCAVGSGRDGTTPGGVFGRKIVATVP